MSQYKSAKKLYVNMFEEQLKKISEASKTQILDLAQLNVAAVCMAVLKMCDVDEVSDVVDSVRKELPEDEQEVLRWYRDQIRPSSGATASWTKKSLGAMMEDAIVGRWYQTYLQPRLVNAPMTGDMNLMGRRLVLGEEKADGSVQRLEIRRMSR